MATTSKTTQYGRLLVGTREELFASAVSVLVEAQNSQGTGPFDVAFTGGSTPQDWYRWCVATRALPASLLQAARFTVSDERCVPLHSDQSNFGMAERLLLTPLGIPPVQQRPWPVHLLPDEAAEAYTRTRADESGSPRGYTVCFLGMGDDGHTASVFPGSALLADTSGRRFAAVHVPGKGWRLTITPEGLGDCRLIVIMTLGAGKAAMLKRVFTDPYNPAALPVQILKRWSDRVIWLVDHAAAAGV